MRQTSSNLFKFEVGLVVEILVKSFLKGFNGIIEVLEAIFSVLIQIQPLLHCHEFQRLHH